MLGIDIDDLSREWKYTLEQRDFPQYAQRPPLNVGAREVVSKSGANFKPVLYQASKDSVPELLFLSPRTGYTSLYGTTLGAGETGVKKLLEGERSAEFESFHAYESGIDVNGNGVVALISKYLERDALVLWDLHERRVVGRYQYADLVGMKSPGWDAEGKRVVFEGLSAAGFSDLYIIDFDTQQRTALTNDKYGDHDPDWSPDGKTIVFLIRSHAPWQ